MPLSIDISVCAGKHAAAEQGQLHRPGKQPDAELAARNRGSARGHRDFSRRFAGILDDDVERPAVRQMPQPVARRACRPISSSSRLASAMS